MNPYIRSTKDYSKFDLHFLNRNVKKNRHRELLEESMKKHGWILAYPMHCTKENGTIVIKDGHQRMSAAMSLNIPVKFIICDDDIPLTKLVDTINPWTLQDFLDSHVRAGNLAYVAVKEYMEKTGLTLSTSISLLSGKSAGSGNQISKFKRGYYVLGDPWLSVQVKDIVLNMKALELPFATSSLFAQALSKVLWVPDFSVSHFRQKLSSFSRLLKKQPTIDEYIRNIEELYNYRSQKKLPLAFMADEISKDRNVSYKK